MRSLLLSLIAILAITACSPAPAAEPVIASGPPAYISTGGKCPPLSSMQSFRAWAAAQVKSTPTGDFPAALRTDEFARMCGDRKSKSLLCTGGAGRQPTLEEVREVDWALRQTFEYRDDFIQTGRTDDWVPGAVTCGDCEDYALSLADKLHQAGIGGQYLRLVIWAPYADAGHATLLIDTANAGEIEVGVGDVELPHPMDWAYGKRFATIRFDGKRVLISREGFWCNQDGCADLAKVPLPKS